MAKKDALAKAPEFAALAAVGDVDPMEIIEVNLGGELTPDLLTRVKMPSSGSTIWEVPNINGEMDGEKDISGVMVGMAPKRVCFEKTFEDSDGDEKPICYSDDAVMGVGSDVFEARPCKGCPHDAWGSGKGDGKKCQERKVVLILREESFLPLLIDLSVMSLKPLKKYMADLSGMQKFFFTVVSSFKLEKCENSNKKPYSELRPSFVADLSDEQKAAARKMWVSLSKGFMQRVQAVDEEETIEGDW